MIVKYRIRNCDTQSLEMKEETYKEICKEFGNFRTYLKSMLSEPITNIQYDNKEKDDYNF